jgi:hypothetical protein
VCVFVCVFVCVCVCVCECVCVCVCVIKIIVLYPLKQVKRSQGPITSFLMGIARLHIDHMHGSDSVTLPVWTMRNV